MTMMNLKKKIKAQNKDAPLPIQEDHVLEQGSAGLVSSSKLPCSSLSPSPIPDPGIYPKADEKVSSSHAFF